MLTDVVYRRELLSGQWKTRFSKFTQLRLYKAVHNYTRSHARRRIIQTIHIPLNAMAILHAYQKDYECEETFGINGAICIRPTRKSRYVPGLLDTGPTHDRFPSHPGPSRTSGAAVKGFFEKEVAELRFASDTLGVCAFVFADPVSGIGHLRHAA